MQKKYNKKVLKNIGKVHKIAASKYRVICLINADLSSCLFK